jgi:hypothetical protein
MLLLGRLAGLFFLSLRLLARRLALTLTGCAKVPVPVPPAGLGAKSSQAGKETTESALQKSLNTTMDDDYIAIADRGSSHVFIGIMDAHSPLASGPE